MGKLSGEFREPNRKDKVTRFPSVTYTGQLGLLVTTLASNLNATKSSHDIFFLQFMFYFSFADLEHEIWATITVS